MPPKPVLRDLRKLRNVGTVAVMRLADSSPCVQAMKGALERKGSVV